MWKQMRHSGRLAALLLAAAMLLAACGGQAPDNGAEEPEIFSITAAVSAESRADVEAHHLYENLMAWADDGRGFARLVPGQAEDYTVETDYTGCATYTFTLRRGLTWSDGQAVTAGDFADAWRRLAAGRTPPFWRSWPAMTRSGRQGIPAFWRCPPRTSAPLL